MKYHSMLLGLAGISCFFTITSFMISLKEGCGVDVTIDCTGQAECVRWCHQAEMFCACRYYMVIRAQFI